MSNTSPTFSGVAPPAGCDFEASCSGAHAGTAHSRTAASSAAATGRTGIGLGIGSSIVCTERRRPHATAQLVAPAAARLVQVGASHDHPTAARHLAVGAVGRLAAHDADGER